jgi:hypothetical protein
VIIERKDTTPLKMIPCFIFIQLLGIVVLNFKHDAGICLYGFGFIGLLLFYILGLKHNKLSLLFAGGIFIYFYQVPFIQIIEKDTIGTVYAFYLSQTDLVLFFSAYTLIIALYLPILIILKKINTKDIIIPWNSYTKFMYKICFVLFFILIIYNIRNAGGFFKYLLLNKFESSAAGSVGYFTYRPFFMIMTPIGLSCKKKNIRKITYIAMLIAIVLDTLGAKRTMILVSVIFIYLYLFDIHKLSIKSFSIAGTLFFFMNLIKKTYYGIQKYLLGTASFDEIFWFKWGDFLQETLLIGEGHGHIVLFANYLYRDIEYHYAAMPNMVTQFIAMIPFSRGINNYISAGEFLRIYIHEPWAGLASSQYIVAWISLHYIGIVIAFFLLTLLYALFYFCITSKKIMAKLLACSFFYAFLFYLHREEILIFKNIFVYFVCIAFISILFFIEKFIISGKIKYAI